MNDVSGETRSVAMERDLPYPPEKVWRALTQPHFIEEWLMKNDFEPVVGRSFAFRADWGQVGCQVLEVEPHRTLAYTWAAMGLQSTVTWTLMPSRTGTHLRMVHAGFQPDQEQAFRGANYGWQQFLAKLQDVLARAD